MRMELEHSVAEWEAIVLDWQMFKMGYPTTSHEWEYAETFLKLSPRLISRFVPIVPTNDRVAA